ncbi:MAG: hypothetical protein OXN84_17580 [Albidovulum sp.]|nr:hypothetical protein [Albidovulum sp.]
MPLRVHGDKAGDHVENGVDRGLVPDALQALLRLQLVEQPLDDGALA